MNKKLLGVICMAGGAAYLALGFKFLVSGAATNDFVDLVLSTIWSLGGICGILGMIAGGVTGKKAVFRVLSYLPILAFGLNIAGNIVQALNKGLDFNPLTIISLLLLVVSMILLGIFTVIAKVWTGGKQVAPFLPAVMPFIGMAIGGLLHIVGAVNVSLVALSWVLLGYLVLTQD
jgi:hypothetical protein